MRVLIVATIAGLALAGCGKQAEAPPADMSNADSAVADAAAPAALASINETSWEFVDPKTGKAITESVDSNGMYIANAGTEHFDHGTATMKDGKACFTSAMNKDGEQCWTDPMVAVGQSGETVNDKGEKLTVKRVTYTPLTM